MGRLDERVILVTGGAGGMGENHVRKFIAEGAQVVITDIDAENGNQLAEELGSDALFIQHDVTDESEWEEVVQKTESHFGPIYGLVNNVGMVDELVPIEETSLDSYNTTMSINATGTFLGMKYVIPSMKKAEEGSIVNISSQAGLQGNPNGVAYVASKFAVTGMTKTAALELGPHNIRVNSVHPGVVETNLMKGQEDTAGALIETIPLGRAQEKEDITNTVLFLLSDDSAGSTGSEFVVDGGMTA